MLFRFHSHSPTLKLLIICKSHSHHYNSLSSRTFNVFLSRLHSSIHKILLLHCVSGWFNNLADTMKRQFLAQYAKFQLNSSAASGSKSQQHHQHRNEMSNNLKTNGNNDNSHKVSALPFYRGVYTAGASLNNGGHKVTLQNEGKNSSAVGNDFHIDGNTSGASFLRRYAGAGHHHYGSTPPSSAVLAGLDRRHRSPDPPPRYNRGQSPLLLRKNLLELSGQPTASPLMNRR